jgi:hypothetical protein
VPRRIEIQIIGDPDSLARASTRGVGAVNDLGDASDHGTSRWSKYSGAAKAAALGGIGAVVTALGSSVNAARDAQVSQTQMETQLKALGISYEGHAAEIDGVIQKTSKLAGLDDEDLQTAFTNIVRTTGDVTKSLRLTGLAADFARAKHIDVAKAGEIVAKVAGGNTGILGRYGVTIQKGATATEALGALQQKFGGQAEAYGKTAAGAQDRFKVATENLQEAIGKGLLPVITQLANGASVLLGWFEKHKTIGIGLVAVMGALGGVLVAIKVATLASAAADGIAAASKLAMAGATGIATIASGGFTTAFWALNAAMTANPIGLVIVAIGLLVAAVVLAWKHCETFRNIVTGAFDAVKTAAVFAFGLIKKAAEYGLLGPLGLIITHWQAAVGILTGAWNGIKSAATTAWNAIKTAIVTPIEGAISLVKTAAGAIDHALDAAWSGIKSGANAAWDFVHDHILGPIRDARDAVRGIVDALGDKVAAGWNAVKDTVVHIGGAVLGALRAPFDQAWGAISGIVDKIKRLISSVTSIPGHLLHSLGLAQGGDVHRAIGGAGGVIARVGELGPETVYLPVGAHVTQASQSRGGGGGVDVHIHGNVGSMRAARALADRLNYRLQYG